ncbi:MAG: glycosyltransferase [Clostridia bacterium]|nr:glycosyltransferase [Clostridia bacterium]
MKKKLLFVIPNLMGGGAERVLVNLVNALDKEKFDVTLLSIFDCGINKSDLSDAVHYRCIYKRQFRGNSRLFALFSPEKLHDMFIKETYDVEIAFLEGVAARIVSGCTKKCTKKVCWIHTSVAAPDVFVKGFRNLTEAQSCYQRFDAAVCVSQSVKQDFDRQAGPDATVLYNPLDGEKILTKANENATLLVNDGLPSVCAVGKLEPVKGFERLIPICAALRSAGIPVRFYILGEGSAFGALSALIGKYDVGDLFSLSGFQENPYAVMAKCDVFVCSSRREGFSSVTAEAMFCKTPVVTVDVPGMRELVGDCGLICENNDEALYNALKTMLTDGQLRAQCAARAFARVQQFDRQHAVGAIEEFLWDL